jgi:hypothetical protein
MKVSRQIHVLTDILAGKGTLVPNTQEAQWAQQPVCTKWRRETFCRYELNTDPLVVQPVAKSLY